MKNEDEVAQHYHHGSLIGAIEDALSTMGKSIDSLTIDDLGPVDEFHIGGRVATKHFLDQLGLKSKHNVLDIGCGLGGAARFVNTVYSCSVSGIDLTPEYIETGMTLCEWLGLDQSIELHQGSALSLPFNDDSFDAAYMMHVGMNIEDKGALFREVARVLKAGAMFGVYDVMQDQQGIIEYPVPWATIQDTSKLEKPERYVEHLEEAGFSIQSINSRRDFALEFFEQLRAKTQSSGGPPPLGLHTLMKASTPEKVSNMIANIKAELIAPVEIIASKN